jgi:plasmid stabilization system protein ParE
MVDRVVWSSQAVEDVDAIASYIARDSPSYAAAMVQKIIAATRVLTHCPLAGRVIAEGEESSLRELSAYCYRIIYRIDNKKVTVAAVIHGKNLLDLEL